MCYQDGFTPLYLACCGGHLEVMKLLVAEGADVDRTDSLVCFSALDACYDIQVMCCGVL